MIFAIGADSPSGNIVGAETPAPWYIPAFQYMLLKFNFFCSTMRRKQKIARNNNCMSPEALVGSILTHAGPRESAMHRENTVITAGQK